MRLKRQKGEKMSRVKKACAAAAIVAAYFAPSMRQGADGPREISQEGLSRIVNEEGCMYCSYQDSTGVWTEGVGATRGVDGRRVKQGDALTDHEVALLFRRDIKSAEQCVSDTMNGWDMPQTVYDSMVDIVFNVGCEGVSYNRKRKANTSIYLLANQGEWLGVCGHMTDFVWAGGKRSAGLEHRRTDQKAYCLSYTSQ